MCGFLFLHAYVGVAQLRPPLLELVLMEAEVHEGAARERRHRRRDLAGQQVTRKAEFP